MRLANTYIYPIKSTRGIRLDTASVTPLGLTNDRRFVLCDTAGKFLTARTLPQLLKVETEFDDAGLTITAPGAEPLRLSYSLFSNIYRTATVWGSEINSQHCSAEADRWFSKFLGRECQLLYFGEQSSRPLKHYPEHQTAFADGYPLLLTSAASLEDLNSRCSSDVAMAQMRPNLVISGAHPYEEDSWKRIRIGNVEFQITKPCGRCILTTVNTETLERQPDREPFSVLKKYRKGSDGEAHFGQNMIALNSGTIHLGDPIEILETQVPEQYSVLSA